MSVRAYVHVHVCMYAHPLHILRAEQGEHAPVEHERLNITIHDEHLIAWVGTSK